ncbi:hypothetical protein LOD99_9093 [Oopsacas minuta]|uniref:Bystin n=1 Tax=Oopsacas minuta TaxID=111878 RepID=A0AAV7JEC0_9METZ|nr:hypothetical protein LOD99_9093 [Oopsacas minuta]
MGKTKKIKRSYKERRETLTKQILSTDRAKKKSPSPELVPLGDTAEPVAVAPSMSSKILRLAREQQQELMEEHLPHPPDRLPAPSLVHTANLDSDTSSDSGSDIDENYEQSVREARTLEKELGKQDADSIDKFLPAEGVGRYKISDLIEHALKEKRGELSDVRSHMSGASTGLSLDAPVVSLFKKVGVILSEYRAGKIPKAFKALPRLQRWEEILLLTEPDNWTAATVYQATRLFASNAVPSRVERFYRLVLLPRIRDDITEFGKLNYHLYAALKKSLFKPAAFFKSILLPLATTEGCSLREACIISSLLVKTSIPVLHSGACLMKLAETVHYSGPVSVFMRVLINKQYCLPYRVLDSLVNYFIRFDTNQHSLPVLWHQCLLVLVQTYSHDMAADQRQALTRLTDKKRHHSISPIIRKFLIVPDKVESQNSSGDMEIV